MNVRVPASTDSGVSPPPVRIAVGVCTFQRNEPLRRLLEAIERNAEHVRGRAEIGVVVVDDNPDRRAAAVCRDFESAFALGLHYRTSGASNISLARNLALEAAIEIAEWVAMTDDDCVPVDSWLASLLDAQERTGNDAITGGVHLLAGSRAPRWLVEQPFLEDGMQRFEEDESMGLGCTANSFLRTQFFRDRPDLRFEPGLGVVGGEDMVFFRTAVRRGLTISFSTQATVHGYEPPDRWRYRYRLRSSFWLGNTEWVTNRFLGEAARPRWVLRSLKALAMAVLRPLDQVRRGEPPQLRYALARAARAVGMLVGAVGVRIRHH